MIPGICFSAGNPNVPVLQHTLHKKINLNTANIEELTNSFKGIGEKRASNIVNYRKTHGNFKSINDLANVKGFGNKFIEKNLSQLQNNFSTE